MNKANVKLIVFFEDPFWVGVFERMECGMLAVCKITFGSQPKDCEIDEWILENYYLLKFSPFVEDFIVKKTRVNPKRLQRLAKKETQNIGISTKSQQALQLKQEQYKLVRKKKSKEQKELEKKLQFNQKQEKRKQKHKGR